MTRRLESEAVALRSRWVLCLLVAGVFVWSYWPTIADLWGIWQRNADYSAGQFVPLIALYVIWSRRRDLAAIPVTTCWWGLGLLAFSQCVRLAAVLLSYGSFEQYSLVLAIVGTVLLVFGWPMTNRLRWVLAFLLLIAPLPRTVHAAIALPMQRFATSSAVFCLETLGYLIQREGNVLVLSEGNTISVAEACSGLRMLTAFVVVGATLAFIVRRPMWQKALLVLSTLPVAVLVNTLRVTATAIVAHRFGAEASDRFFHDYAGLLMMPVAVGLLIAFLRIMGPAPPAAGSPGDPATARQHALQLPGRRRGALA